MAGVDVGFSEDRFLRGVLLEAQRGDARGAAVDRLVRHGFGPEAARVALTVAGGDEKRALELCMAGMTFTGGSSPKASAPPVALSCHVCGGKHLNEKSLEIHLKACRRRFEQREAKLRPEGERRAFLEAFELAELVPVVGMCLQEYYDGTKSGKTPPAECRPGPTERQQAARSRQAEELLPCEHCGRTFAPDRLATHERVCVQRPRTDPAPPPPRRRHSTGVSSVPAPAAAVRAFESFCQNLATCPGCSRQFRPELLQQHLKQCTEGQKSKDGHARSSPATGARGSHQPRRLPIAAPSAAKTPTGAHTPSSPASLRRSSLPGSYAFTPPGRARPSSGSASVPTPQASSSPSAPSADELATQSVEALAAKGYLIAAPDEKAEALRAQFTALLPNAQVVGTYEVSHGRAAGHRGIYDAMRLSLEEERGDEPEELELWHGTSWSTVPKILRQGFNRSFAGRHGTLLGVATYFSSDAAYSQRFCDRHGGGKNGTKAMLLARVLVGRSCKGSSGDVEPPLLPGAEGEEGTRYDSTVDNPERPTIFAVFRDFQAVPLYLVEFT